MNRIRINPTLAMSAALAALLLVPVAGAAQTGADSGPAVFEGMDADGDGVVTREEFEAFMAERPMLRERAFEAPDRRPGRMGREGRTQRDERWNDRQGNRHDWANRGRMEGGMDSALREQMQRRMDNAMRGVMQGMMGERMPGLMGEHMGGGIFGPMGWGMDGADPEAIAERLIERFDTDGDGMLTGDEIAAGIEAMRAMRTDPAARAQAMFEHFDTDGDGVISAEEFEAAHTEMEARMQRAHPMQRGGMGWMAPKHGNGPAEE